MRTLENSNWGENPVSVIINRLGNNRFWEKINPVTNRSAIDIDNTVGQMLAYADKDFLRSVIKEHEENPNQHLLVNGIFDELEFLGRRYDEPAGAIKEYLLLQEQVLVDCVKELVAI